MVMISSMWMVWHNDSDLDLRLLLPGGGHVAYWEQTVTFNGATAQLDHDNMGDVIDQAPDLRVENIVVTSDGALPSGTYSFFAHFYGGSETTPAQITVTGDDGATTLSGIETLSYENPLSPSYNVLIGTSGSVSYELAAPPIFDDQ